MTMTQRLGTQLLAMAGVEPEDMVLLAGGGWTTRSSWKNRHGQELPLRREALLVRSGARFFVRWTTNPRVADPRVDEIAPELARRLYRSLSTAYVPWEAAFPNATG